MRDVDASGRELTGEIGALHSRITKLEQVSHESARRKNVDDELDKAWCEWETTFDAIKDSIILTDNEFRIVQANRAASQLFGKSLDEIIGKTCWHLVHGIDHPPEECPLKKAKGTKKHEEIELYLPQKGIWVTDSVDPILDEQGGLTGAVHIIRDITKRKKAEESLRESKDFSENLIASMKDGFSVLDTNGVHIQVNPALCQMTGFSKEELLGTGPPHPYWPQEEYEHIEATFQRTLRGDFHDFELVFKRKSGERFPVIVSPSCTRDKEGNPKTYFATVKDITDRKQAERLLRRERDRAQQYLDVAGVMFVAIDSEQRVGLINKKGCQILGYKEEEVIAKNWFDKFLPEKIREQVREVFEKLLRGEAEAPEYYENPILTQNGQERLIAWHNTVLRDDKGRVVAVLSSGEDITERKKAEEALQHSEEYFRALTENSSDIIIIVDKKGTILYISSSIERFSGYKPEELIGKSAFDFIHPDDLPRAINDFGKAIQTKDVAIPNSFRVRHKDGSEFVLEGLGKNLLDNPVIKGFVMNVRDITERKKAEEQLQQERNLLRTLIDHIPDSVYVKDRGSRFVACNKSVIMSEGVKIEEELIGKTDFDLYEKVLAQQFFDSEQELMLTGRPIINREYKGPDKTGSVCCVLVTKVPLRDRHGNIVGMVGINRDVTERRRAEDALRKSEYEKTLILDNASEIIAYHDTDHNILWANRAYLKATGLSLSQIKGKKCYHAWGLNGPCKDCPVTKTMETGEPQSAELIPQNQPHWSPDRGSWLSRSAPVKDKTGRVIGAIEVAFSITERKRAEKALKETEIYLRTVLSSAPITIFAIDNQGLFTLSEGKGLEKAGLKPGENVGMLALDLYGTLSFAEENGRVTTGKDIIQRVLAGETVNAIDELRGVYFDNLIAPMRDAEGKVVGIVGVATDITERKRTEQKLLEDQAQLKSLSSELTLTEERERHRLATELHDRISQSLVISKIKLDALRKSGRSRKLDKALEDVCNSIGQTIQDTRTLTFDLSNPVLYELGFETAVSEWLTDQIQKKHGLAVEFEDDKQPKPLDDDVRILLFRDVRELLVNVVKHAGAHKVKVSVRKLDNHICVTVEDDGVGFDPVEVLSGAARRGEFGLFSIRERLEDLGGHLQIDSAPGQGCKVTMTAPLKQKEMTQ